MLVVENTNTFLLKFSNRHGFIYLERPKVTGKKDFSHLRFPVAKKTKVGRIRCPHTFIIFQRRGSKINYSSEEQEAPKYAVRILVKKTEMKMKISM